MSYTIQDNYGDQHLVDLENVLSVALLPPDCAIIKLKTGETIVAIITTEFLELLYDFEKRLVMVIKPKNKPTL